MITLHVFGPAFGLPDPSPFVTKAEVLLKLAGVPYETIAKGLSGAPKGKLPFIEDASTLVADSTFIRAHLESRYGVDFDKGLSPKDRGVAWAFEKLCDDHVYWMIIKARWMDDANFAKGPSVFFERVPMPLRPLVIAMVRRRLRKTLWLHGLGRHTDTELQTLTSRALTSIADFLGDKPYLMGDTPSGADATVWSFVAGCLCAHFTTPLRDAAEKHQNLIRYRDRGMKEWFPSVASGA